MATLKERLVEAEAAYHDLVLGRAARVVHDANGERIEYTAARRADLAAYIADLKRQINQTTDGPIFLVMN